MKGVATGLALGLAAISPADAASASFTASISGTYTPSGPITINASNTTIQGYHITSTSGPCVTVSGGVSNVTIQNNNIGPCGDNNTTNPSHGVYITGNSSADIYDNYIHVENLASACVPSGSSNGSHNGVYIYHNTGSVAVQGNVIAYNERNVRISNSSNVAVSGNFLLNPRGSASCSNPDNQYGHSFQTWDTANSNITVSGNYILNSNDTTTYLYAQENSDAINFGYTASPIVQNNYIVGGTWRDGCAIQIDTGTTGATVTGNIVSNSGAACGISLAAGTNDSVSGNKVLNVLLSSDLAGVIIDGAACPVSITNNIASAFQTGGYNQAYWNNGSCASPTLSGNTFDTGCATWPSTNGCGAYNELYPMATTDPPPPIPPMPKNCVAVSPYSNNTSMGGCVP